MVKKILSFGRSEFYDKAVSSGYYGNEESGLTGKYDNVRKYWEEMNIKLYCRPILEKILAEVRKISILDIGCGIGEGYNLLTHIPPANPRDSVERDFLLSRSSISKYVGIDMSKTAIEQGRLKYRRIPNVRIEYNDFTEGLPESVTELDPFDIYFSSFSSLSLLTHDEFDAIMTQIISHARKGSAIYFDVLGKYSPEWPKYWNKKESMQPYTVAYLLPAEKRRKKEIKWFVANFWSPEELTKAVKRAAHKAGKGVKFSFISDLSILTGRHMDTGLMSPQKMAVRYQVNRLFDHGFRGDARQLEVNLTFLKDFCPAESVVWKRLFDYQIKWNRVTYILGALLNHKDEKIRKFIEEADNAQMSDDLKFLVWLFRNSDRFPVADFWSSVLGPQVAVVLRNIEMSYSEGVGCGHSLMCGLEVT